MRIHRERDHYIINPGQDWQCRWWARELGVAPEQLRQAIREAGPLARNVRIHLEMTETRRKSSE